MQRRQLARFGVSVAVLMALAGGAGTRMPMVSSWTMPTVSAQGGFIAVTSTAQEVTVNAPSGIANGNCTLGEAMLAANAGASVDGCQVQGSAPYSIDLQQGQTYVLSEVANWWYGPNALPPVANAMIFDGHGATLQVPSGTVRLRFFYVGANPTATGTLGYHTPGAGSLTLRELTLTGGRQHGGDSQFGGGGAGMGGAIFNHGLLLLDRVTLQDNRASGGNTLLSSEDNHSGGGMGQKPVVDGNWDEHGGGFGGPVSPAGSRGYPGLGGGGFGPNDHSPSESSNGGGVSDGLGGRSFSGDYRGGAGSGAGFARGGDFGYGGLFTGFAGGGGGVGGGGGGCDSYKRAGAPCGSGGFGGGGGGEFFDDHQPGFGGFGGGGGNSGYGGFGGGAGSRHLGGGGAGMGGALFNHGGTVIVLASTLTANDATGGSALYPFENPQSGSGFGGAIFNLNGRVEILASTLTANEVHRGVGEVAGSEAGGAVYSLAYTLLQRQASLVIANSILSGSSTGETPTSDVVSYQPANLLPASCINCANQATVTLMFAGAANIVQQLLVIGGSTSGPAPIAADPLLQPLADNGGPTMTFGLQPGSPALDVAGPQVHPETFSVIVVDQRGISRPADLLAVSNGAGNGTDLGAFEFQCSAIALPSSAPPNGTLNTAYAHTFTATGGTAPYTFFATALPPGLSLTSAGQLTGTPTAGGTFEFTVGVYDAYGCTNNGHYSLTIADSTCGIGLTPATLAQPYVAIPYWQMLGTSGGSKYILSVTAGMLPHGVQLVSTSSGSALLGIPKTPGTYTFTITGAKSGSTCRPTRTYTVTIPKTVVPLLTCVQKINSTTYRGTFGFDNTTGGSVTIPVGADNYFTPGAQNRGQATVFPTGTTTAAFSITFTANHNNNDLAVWFLRGPDGQKRLVTVTRATYGCQ